MTELNCVWNEFYPNIRFWVQVTVKKYASGDNHCKNQVAETLTFDAAYKDCTKRPDGVHVRYKCKEGTLQETR